MSFAVAVALTLTPTLSQADWPPATRGVTEGTVETPMVQLPVGEGSAGFHSTAVLHFDLARAPRAVHFVMQNRDTGKWCVPTLDDAESSLGDAKRSLGDAKSSLGDATSSLGDAKKRCQGSLNPTRRAGGLLGAGTLTRRGVAPSA
jgi:hypothetical protein